MVSVGIQSERKGKGNGPGGQKTVGGILGILAVWSPSARFQLPVLIGHGHGPPTMGGPVVWREHGRAGTSTFTWVCPAPSTAF